MRNVLAVLALVLMCASNVRAGGGLDAFLGRVNVEAQADLSAFTARISAQFGVSEARVRVVLSSVSEPAEVFMVFQLGEFCGCGSDYVLTHYRAQKGRGWGVLAKELGIKPGSPEFHALKNGDLYFTGVPADHGKNKGHGNGKGHKS